LKNNVILKYRHECKNWKAKINEILHKEETKGKDLDSFQQGIDPKPLEMLPLKPKLDQIVPCIFKFPQIYIVNDPISPQKTGLKEEPGSARNLIEKSPENIPESSAANLHTGNYFRYYR